MGVLKLELRPSDKGYYLPAVVHEKKVDFLRGFRKLLNKAAIEAGMTWNELRRASPPPPTETVAEAPETTIFVEVGQQLSLMEMHRSGLTQAAKEVPISTKGQPAFREPWGRSTMEQRVIEARARQQDSGQEPWLRFDREREIERAPGRRTELSAQFESLLTGPGTNLASRFAPGRRNGR